jgi:hypothetical protein
LPKLGISGGGIFPKNGVFGGVENRGFRGSKIGVSGGRKLGVFRDSWILKIGGFRDFGGVENRGYIENWGIFGISGVFRDFGGSRGGFSGISGVFWDFGGSRGGFLENGGPDGRFPYIMVIQLLLPPPFPPAFPDKTRPV